MITLSALLFICEHPTLLEEAPDTATTRQMSHRVNREIHLCLMCGERSQLAFVAKTDVGKRWLDLCFYDAIPIYGNFKMHRIVD